MLIISTNRNLVYTSVKKLTENFQKNAVNYFLVFLYTKIDFYIQYNYFYIKNILIYYNNKYAKNSYY